MSAMMEAGVLAGAWLMEVDMMPVFFTAHCIIANVIVREDTKNTPGWRHAHPFTSWLCTVVCGLSGVFVHSFLFGDSMVDVFADHTLLIFCTVMWYVMNYSPYDVMYTCATWPPVVLAASALQEVLRLRFLYLGLQAVAASHPGQYLLILIGGIVKGNGYGFLKIAERLIRGKWTPEDNDLLNVPYFFKSAVYASLIFLLHTLHFIPWPVELTYLAVAFAFISFRIAITTGQTGDPLLALEAPVSWLLFADWSKQEVKLQVPSPAKVQQVTPKSKQSKKKD